MILLQLSAAQGPAECCLAVAKALLRLQREAEPLDVEVAIVEREPGPEAGTWRSVLLELEGAAAEELAARWCGTVLWVCPSPYRPVYPRKNWFIGVTRFEPPAQVPDGDIHFETARSSGPGGQHVNTTDSAVRATHAATGISVRVQSGRSQHANKQLALRLIAHKLKQRETAAAGELIARRRMAHHEVERGRPVRTFRGERFL